MALFCEEFPSLYDVKVNMYMYMYMYMSTCKYPRYMYVIDYKFMHRQYFGERGVITLKIRVRDIALT